MLIVLRPRENTRPWGTRLIGLQGIHRALIFCARPLAYLSPTRLRPIFPRAEKRESCNANIWDVLEGYKPLCFGLHLENNVIFLIFIFLT